jgi:ABC-type bacteriocin/lantibiotic exporter with double-glycine peptidase domain
VTLFLSVAWRRNIGLIAVVLQVFLAASCSRITTRLQIVEAITRGEEPGHYVSSVPFIYQKDKRCGTAALASVLRYYGDPVSEEGIARDIFSPELKGTLLSDLENFARRRGFYTRVYPGSLSDVKRHIERNEPVIILIDDGFSAYQRPHYLVAVGYNEKRRLVIVHTGPEADALWSYGRLESAWARMNHLCLLILPVSKATKE